VPVRKYDKRKTSLTNSAIRKSANSSRPKRKKEGWQAIKSANTRRTILEAAIQCIIDYGYARTTTSLIADYANVSRGAMMHHFPSRQAVLKATIKYLHKKRLSEYNKMMEAIGIPFREMSREKIAQSVAEAWKYVNLPSSLAYQEILMASRTDQELRQVLEPQEKDFEKTFIERIKKMFTPWAGREELEVVHDAALFMLTGMMLSHMKSNKKVRTKRVMDFLTESVTNLYEKAGELR